MNQSAHLEIHFYTEYEAAVVFETFAQNDERKIIELQAFSSFAMRHFINMQTSGIPLASLFASMKDGNIGSYANYFWILSKLNTPEEMILYIPFVAALGVDLSEVVKMIPAFAMLRAAAGHDNKEIAKNLWPNIAHVVTYRGAAASKRFMADFEWKDDKVFLKLDQKGFGVFGKGINYYAPMSVVLFLKYSTDKHVEDRAYVTRYRKAVQLCGQAFLDGKVNSSSQIELPILIEKQTLQNPKS
jgi:hypothetical protein